MTEQNGKLTSNDADLANKVEALLEQERELTEEELGSVAGGRPHMTFDFRDGFFHGSDGGRVTPEEFGKLDPSERSQFFTISHY